MLESVQSGVITCNHISEMRKTNFFVGSTEKILFPPPAGFELDLKQEGIELLLLGTNRGTVREGRGTSTNKIRLAEQTQVLLLLKFQIGT